MLARSDGRPTRVGALLCLVLLTLLVGGTRSCPSEALLPHQVEPDPYCVLQGRYLLARDARGGGTPEELLGPGSRRLLGYYPLHLARLWTLGGDPERPDRRLGASTLDAHLRAAREPYRRARRIGAWLSALALPAVYLVGRRFLGRGASLAAAGLAGTSLLWMVVAGSGKPHAWAAAAIAWGLWGALELRRRPGVPRALAAGLALGLGISSMHYGALLAGPVLVALVAPVPGRRGARSAGDARGHPDPGAGWWLRAALPAGLLALGVVLASDPGRVLGDPPASVAGAPSAPGPAASAGAGSPVDAAADVTAEVPVELLAASAPPPAPARAPRLGDGGLELLGHRLDLSRFSLRHPLQPLAWLWGSDPWLVGLAGLGLGALLVALRRWPAERRGDLAVLAAHALPYLAVLALYDQTRARYTLPLVPHLALLGAGALALGARVLTGALPARTPAAVRAWAPAALAAGFLLLPARAIGARLASARTPDTLERTARLVQDLLGARGRVALGPGVVLPLAARPEDLGALLAAWPTNPWLRYQAELGPDLAPEDGGGPRMVPLRLDAPEVRAALEDPDTARRYVTGLRADLVVLEISQRTAALGPAQDHLRRALREHGHVVRHLVPRPRPQLPYLDFADQPDARERILGQERLGPVVEVWRLGR